MFLKEIQLLLAAPDALTFSEPSVADNYRNSHIPLPVDSSPAIILLPWDIYLPEHN
jgi:hypothetical protein